MAGARHGDPTRFLTIKRAEPARQAGAERRKDWREFYVPAPDEQLRTQGARCMDCGVPFCQGDTGCPVQNVIPEWNDARPARAAGSDALDSRCMRRTTSPSSRAASAPRPASRRACSASIEQPVAIRQHRAGDRRPSFAEGWVVPRRRRARLGLSRRRRRLRSGGSRRGAAAAPRWDTRWSCSRRTIASAACSATASPTSSWRRRCSIAGFGSSRPKACTSRRASRSARDLHVTTAARRVRRRAARRRRAAARELRVPGRELGGVHLAMDYLTQQNRASPATRSTTRARSGPAASESSSSAAATPAPTASAPRIARARARSSSSSCFPSRRRTAPSPRRGRSGRCSCARATRTRRAASATGACRRRSSSGDGRVQRLHAVRVELQQGANGPQFVEMAGSELHARRRSRAARHGLHRRAEEGLLVRPRRDDRSARRRGDRRAVSHQRARRLRRRRRASRRVAHRVGDPRRPRCGGVDRSAPAQRRVHRFAPALGGRARIGIFPPARNEGRSDLAASLVCSCCPCVQWGQNPMSVP